MKVTQTKQEEKRQYINDPDTIARINRLLNDPAYAAQPDDDPRNPWAAHQEALRGNVDVARMSRLDAMSISRFDAMGLQLLSLLEAKVITIPMPQEIELLVQRFLENSVGNTKLTSFLKQEVVKNMDLSNSYTSHSAINSICELSFRTRNFGQGENVMRLARMHHSSIAGNSIPDQDKLSLKELSVAFDLTKISILKQPYIVDLIKKSPKLDNIYTSSIKAQQIFNHMEQESAQDVKKLSSGVLILHNTHKFTELSSRNIAFRDRARMNLITRYHHAAMLDLSKTRPLLSDISYDRGYTTGDFGIMKQLYSDMYKIDPVALIPKEHHQLLKQVYGEDWQLQVASKFKIIENEISINRYTKFNGQIAGVAELENASGVASVIPFGHKKLQPNDFEELHQDVMIREKYNQNSGMLCSSFCAISIATSLVELNKQIKKDIVNSQPAQDPKKINTLNIVTIPFGKYEDLSKIHPERLLETLKSYNCVKPLPLKVVGHYIKEASHRVQAAKKYITEARDAFQEKAVDRLLNRKKPVIQSRL